MVQSEADRNAPGCCLVELKIEEGPWGHVHGLGGPGFQRILWNEPRAMQDPLAQRNSQHREGQRLVRAWPCSWAFRASYWGSGGGTALGSY